MIDQFLDGMESVVCHGDAKNYSNRVEKPWVANQAVLKSKDLMS